MKTKHKKTLAAVFSKPASATIVFDDLESLVEALGGQVRSGEGSRVRFELNGKRVYLHRPHPGKQAKRYQIEEMGSFLKRAGVTPT